MISGQHSKSRRTIKILAGLAVAVAIAVIALHVVLARHLTWVINRVAIPHAEEALDVKVRVGESTASLFGGSLRLTDIHIANPPGFEVPDMLSAGEARAKLRKLSLLRGVLEIYEIILNDVRLDLVHSGQGAVNVTELQKDIEGAVAERAGPQSDIDDGSAHDPDAPPSDAHQEAALTSDESVEPPDLLIHNLACDPSISYTHYGIADRPVRLSLKLTLRAQNISTMEIPDAEWGRFTINGHLERNPDAFVTTLTGRIAPLLDPAKPSFDMEGDVLAVNLDELGAIAAEWEVRGEEISLALRVKCRDGQYDPDASQLSLVLKNPTLTGSLARKAHGMPLPPELSITAPLSGPLGDPQLDIEAALIQTVLSNLGGTLQTIIENTTIDGKKLDSDTIKKLGNLLKGWR